MAKHFSSGSEIQHSPVLDVGSEHFLLGNFHPVFFELLLDLNFKKVFLFFVKNSFYILAGFLFWIYNNNDVVKKINQA